MAKAMGYIGIVIQGVTDRKSPLGQTERFAHVMGGNRMSELHALCKKEGSDPRAIHILSEIYLPRTGEKLIEMRAAFAGQVMNTMRWLSSSCCFSLHFSHFIRPSYEIHGEKKKHLLQFCPFNREISISVVPKMFCVFCHNSSPICRRSDKHYHCQSPRIKARILVGRSNFSGTHGSVQSRRQHKFGRGSRRILGAR